MRHQRPPTGLLRTPRLTCAAVGLAAVLGMAGSHALAETVPLPRPAPKERGGSPKPAIGDNTATPLAGTRPPAFQAPPTPMLPDPRARAVTDGTLDATQRAQVAKVSSYLSSLPTLTGNFVQVAPNGNRTTGEFYMQKPGKVRFAYDAPSPVDWIVSDGKSLVVRERMLAKQEVVSLSDTPLRYLLSDRIDLMKETNVVNVSSDDVFITVTIEETHKLIGKSRLMLMFGARDSQLKQWTITDPQGYDVTIAVYNLNTQKKPDPDLFRVDYTRYDDGRGG